MYAAFGNKEDLFAKALAHYVQWPIAYLGDVLSEKTSREVVRQMLLKTVDLLTSEEKPRGCLVILSSISSELESAGIQGKIIEALQQNELRHRVRFDQAIQEGDLPPDTDSCGLAKYVTTLLKACQYKRRMALVEKICSVLSTLR